MSVFFGTAVPQIDPHDSFHWLWFLPTNISLREVKYNIWINWFSSHCWAIEYPQFMHLNTKCKFSDLINLKLMYDIRGEKRRTKPREDREGRYWQSFHLGLMNKFNNNYVMKINNNPQLVSLKVFYVIFQKENYYIHCLWGILICTLKDLSGSSACSGPQHGWLCTLVKKIVNFGISRVKFIPADNETYENVSSILNLFLCEKIQNM